MRNAASKPVIGKPLWQVFMEEEKSSRGGKRIGSGRKPGITDGRKQITIRIKAEILEKLKPKAAKQIRDIVEAALDT